MPEELGRRLGRLVREMGGTKGFTQIELAGEVFDDAGKVRLLRELENGRAANAQTRTYIPICNFLGISSDEIQSLLDQTGKLPSVRGQGFWDQSRPKLRESLAHLVGLIMLRVVCDASAVLRMSFV